MPRPAPPPSPSSPPSPPPPPPPPPPALPAPPPALDNPRQSPTTPAAPFHVGRCAVGHALTGPMCHRPVGTSRGGRGGSPVGNREQRRTRRVPVGLPAVTIRLYVIRTRCLAAPAARGSRLDENRAGPPAHQGGPVSGRHVVARHRQHQPQHLPLGARHGGSG